MAFVGKAIEKLLQNRFVDELSHPAHCCNPLTVADKGKLRLVFDLRHVNAYISLNKFKCENFRAVAENFHENDFFIRFDLTSGYHHIDIHPEHHKYLGFHWRFEGNIARFFHFTVLPFGLSSASYVFTKVLRPFTMRWRGGGIKSVLFLDDGIAAQKTASLTQQAAEKIQEDLTRAGFAINYKKSDFTPKQVEKWLGVIIDTTTMTFYVPGERLRKIKRNLRETLQYNTTTPKELAKLAGTLPAIGPLVGIFIESIYHQVACSHSWYTPLQLTSKTIADLQFWLRNIEHINGYTFKPFPTTTHMVFTDASDDGYGGFPVHQLQTLICNGKFTLCEKQQSSTFRELLSNLYCNENCFQVCIAKL